MAAEFLAAQFLGRSVAVSPEGMTRAADMLSVNRAEIWTVLTVEAGGCGFLPSRHPPIRYERHYFSRLTDRAFDDGDISSREPGGYGQSGEPQYARLARAVALNRAAALQSCSWGMGQIMGANYSRAGFANVEDMVTAMCDSEDAQLLAFAAFLKSSNLDGALRTHDWTSLARGYNGPDYAQNQYDRKLEAAYRSISTAAAPDLTVRAAQLYLTYAGFDPGPVDGAAGARTQAALRRFQAGRGLPETGAPDAATMTALLPAASA